MHREFNEYLQTNPDLCGKMGNLLVETCGLEELTLKLKYRKMKKLQLVNFVASTSNFIWGVINCLM